MNIHISVIYSMFLRQGPNLHPGLTFITCVNKVVLQLKEIILPLPPRCMNERYAASRMTHYDDFLISSFKYSSSSHKRISEELSEVTACSWRDASTMRSCTYCSYRREECGSPHPDRGTKGTLITSSKESDAGLRTTKLSVLTHVCHLTQTYYIHVIFTIQNESKIKQ